MNNSIETCLHSKNCARYEHKMCSNLSYMSSCETLNSYLVSRYCLKIAEKMDNVEEQEHIKGDIGLIKAMKKEIKPLEIRFFSCYGGQ